MLNSLYSFYVRCLLLQQLEEKNCSLAERCNRLSEAVSKCDELAENANQLYVLTKEQRENMQLLKIKCKEMVDRIEKSKCHLVLLFLK